MNGDYGGEVLTVDSVRELIVELRSLGTDPDICAALGLEPKVIQEDILDAMAMAPSPRATEFFLAGFAFGLHQGVTLMGTAATELLAEQSTAFREILSKAVNGGSDDPPSAA